MKIAGSILLISLLAFASCNEGIEPLPELAEPGFSGKITFIGSWPEDIAMTHIVMFKEALEDSNDFNIVNLGFISEGIPSGSDEYNYNTFDNGIIGTIEAREYAYLVVAQSKLEELSLERKDWFVVGIYCNDQDEACTGRLNIPQGAMLEGIDIICDFDNPPPQPPGGL